MISQLVIFNSSVIMFRPIIIIVFVLLTAVCFGDESKEILKPPLHGLPLENSEEAKIEEVPYQVSLLYYGWIFICSGTIISEKVVLTSATCVIGTPSQWLVHAGSNLKYDDGQKVAVSQILVHEEYFSGKVDYDISLFVLSTQINLDGRTTVAIPLVPPGYDIPEEDVAVSSSWGAMDSQDSKDVLHKLIIPIISNEECKELHANSTIIITDTMVCGGTLNNESTSCHGDSGNPLVVDCFLVGVSSWSIGCSQVGGIGIWTRVSAVSQWIENKIASLE